METYVAFGLGFVVGYLVIRAIRSFFTTAGAIVLLLSAVTAVGQGNYHVRGKNTSAANVNIHLIYDGVGTWNWNDVCHPCTTTFVVSGTDLAKITGTATAVGGGFLGNCTLQFVDNTAGAGRYELLWTGAAPKKKYDYNKCFTNMMSCDRTYSWTLTRTVGGVTASDGTIVGGMQPGVVTNKFCLDFSNPFGVDGAGDGYAFTVNVIATGCVENDYLQTAVDSTAPTLTMVTTPPTSVDTDGDSGNTTTDDNSNVSREIREMSEKLARKLDAIATNTASGGGSSTDLSAIRTNTFNTAVETAGVKGHALNLKNAVDYLTNQTSALLSESQAQTNILGRILTNDIAATGQLAYLNTNLLSMNTNLEMKLSQVVDAILTNDMPSDTNELELLRRIQTNTFLTERAGDALGKGLLGNGSNIVGELPLSRTNFLILSTNLTNLLSKMQNTDHYTNQTNATLLQDMVETFYGVVLTNWASSELKGQIHALTNGYDSNSWAGSFDPVSSGSTDDDAFTVPLPTIGGMAMKLEFNPFKNVNLRGKLEAFCSWVEHWIAWLILFLAFWMAFFETKAQVDVALMCGSQVVVPTPDWSEWAAIIGGGFTGGLLTAWYVGKKAMAAFLALLVTALIGIMPTLVIAQMAGYGWHSPLGGEFGLPAYAAAGGAGVLGNCMILFIKIMGWVIPWTLLFTAMANLALFQFYAMSVLMVVCTALRFMVQAKEKSSFLQGPTGWVLLLLGSSLTLEAVPVEVHNWTGAHVVWTNVPTSAMFSFPPGLTGADLPGGEWEDSTGVWEFEENGRRQIVNLVTQQIGTNTVTAKAISEGNSMEEAFFAGFALSMWMNAFAWAVAMIRKGVSLGWSNSA